MRLLGICGSLRPRSYNRMALALVGECLPPGQALDMADLRGIPLFEGDAAAPPEAVRRLDAQAGAAHGLVLACPEYNHSITAVLKNAIDWLSRLPGEPLADKPVMILSATTGVLGGARVQYDVRRILDAVGARPLVRPEVFIGNAQDKFDSAGACTDERTRRFVAEQLDAFCAWIGQLHAAAAVLPPGVARGPRPEPAGRLLVRPQDA